MKTQKNLFLDFIQNSDFYQQVMKEGHMFANKYGYFSPTNHNDAVDAFRHIYANAYAMYKYPQWVVNYLGEKYENTEQNPTKEKIMDLYNNGIGREIGAKLTKNFKSLKFNKEKDVKEYIAYEIDQAIKSNKVITDLNDERVLSKIKNTPEDSYKVYTREDIGKMSRDEFNKKENQIMKQYKSYGIPSNI